MRSERDHSRIYPRFAGQIYADGECIWFAFPRRSARSVRNQKDGHIVYCRAGRRI